LISSKPEIIAPKGLGPGFWPYTIVLTIVNVIVAVYVLFGNLDWVLPAGHVPAADTTDAVDEIFKFMAVFGSAITVYVSGYVVYFAVVFRRRAGENPASIGVQIHDSPKLEIWWTIIPVVLLIVLLFISITEWFKMSFPPTAPALTVEAVGHQFNWEYRYPGVEASTFSPEPLHLPVGKQIRILLTSGDVLHSFWLPQMRLKLDAVPGLVQTINFTPERSGEFDIVCAEFCGVNHSVMQGKLIVESPEAFEQYIAAAKAKATSSAASAGPVLANGNASAGKTLFTQKCAACHSVGGFDQKIVGPGLGHLLNDPQHPNLVDNDPASAPNIAKILVNGYNGPLGVMPNRQANALSDGDIANLVAYLTSLK
jgi:cytochrome c oxidase subunit 2